MRRIILSIASLVLLAGLPLTGAHAQELAANPSCSADGILNAQKLTENATCNAEAKFIDVGIGLIAKPKPGEYIALTVDKFDGESPTVTVATDQNGQTHLANIQPVLTGAPAEKLVATSTPMVNTNCGSPNYYNENGWIVQQPYKWYYNSTGEPAANSLIRIGEGFQTWQSGANRCNSTIVPNSVATSYQGTTTDIPSVFVIPSTSSGSLFDIACSSLTSNKRVIGWGNLLDLAAGVTCNYGFNATTTGVSSIMFNTALSWYTTFDQSYCNGQADLKGIATHEEGHALGLDHYNHVGQVMKPSGGPCDMNMRGLGYGDVHGIAKLLP